LYESNTSVLNNCGPNKDLKVLKIAHPDVSIRPFQKHVPNSSIVRDVSKGPSLPISNIMERSIYNGSPSTPLRVPKQPHKTTSQNDSFFNIGNFARIGSARGQELMNSFANFMPTTASSLPRPVKKPNRDIENTPTRKLSTRFGLVTSEQIPEELNKIERRMFEVNDLISSIDEKLRSELGPGSEKKSL